jgi:hypothetical protein
MVDLLLVPDDYKAALCDEYMEDMEFECFKDILSDGEYRIFYEVLAKPLTGHDDIVERQRIFADFNANPQMIGHLTDVCNSAQHFKMPRYDLSHSSYPADRKLVDYMEIIEKTLGVPSELHRCLGSAVFQSQTLACLRETLDGREEIEEIKQLMADISNCLLKGEVTFQIEYASNFKFKYACVHGAGGHTQNPQRQGLLKSIIKRKPDNGGVDYGYDFVANCQIEDDIIKTAINNHSATLARLNAHILSSCAKLAKHLSFYAAAIKVNRFLTTTGIKMSFPIFTDTDRYIQASNLYNITNIIKGKTAAEAVPNGFSGENLFYYISGVNQGGKTTFLRGIGMAQFFAQNGLPVAAEKYVCPVFTGFVSHFPRDEDGALESGKLAEELTRLRKCLPLIKGRALVLMNESFATTTEREGAEIAEAFLRAVSACSPQLLFVTHNMHLLDNRNKQGLDNGITVKSLITPQSGAETHRTYKITEGEPLEEIHAMEFVRSFQPQ